MGVLLNFCIDTFASRNKWTVIDLCTVFGKKNKKSPNAFTLGIKSYVTSVLWALVSYYLHYQS